MKTKFIALLGAAALVFALAASANAAPVHKNTKPRRVQAHATAMRPMAQVADMSACGSSCGMGSCSTKASATRASSASAQACPVSDPSACPSSCSRSHAATAARTTGTAVAAVAAVAANNR